MKKYQLQMILAGLLIGLFVACSTPRMAQNVSTQLDSLENPVLMIHYRLETDYARIQGSGCELTLANVSAKEKIRIPLPYGQDWALVEVPAGYYAFDEISCYQARKWQVQDLIGQGWMNLQPQRAYYPGKMRFEVSDRGQNLNYGFKRGDGVQELSTALNDFSGTLRGNLFSPYTGKKVSPQILQAEASKEIGVHSRYVQGGEKPRELALEGCLLEELGANPFPLGKLNWTAHYESNRFQRLEKEQTLHTRSDRFEACVGDRLRNFVPGTNGKVHYQIEL
jgi:hypothetical protein